jgi:hypothetical protein
VNKTPCFLNMDETRIQRSWGKAVGYISPKQLWLTSLRPRRPLRHVHSREAMTLVATVAHCPEIQAKLPQICLGNMRTLSAKRCASKGGRVEFWRGRTAWNSAETVCAYLDRLATVFASAQFRHMQPILLLDCAPCHVATKVAIAAWKLGIWLVMVPAKCTQFVQPLDTHGFSAYKSYLYRLLQQKSDGGEMGAETWLSCVAESADQFFRGRKWLSAFQETGVLKGGSRLTPVLRYLKVDRRECVPVPLPSREDIAAVYPARSSVPYFTLLRPAGDMDVPALD